VVPGDVSIERGYGLPCRPVRRFLPSEVSLVISPESQGTRRMRWPRASTTRFLAEYLEVTEDMVYRVAYDRQQTRDYKVTVFDYPSCNAPMWSSPTPNTLDRPPTHPGHSPHQRGGRVTGRFASPAEQAGRLGRLISKEGQTVELAVRTGQPAAALDQFQLATPDLQVQLVDGDGRTNKVPPARRQCPGKPLPELHLVSPRGDHQSRLAGDPVPAEAWDDFGLRQAG